MIIDFHTHAFPERIVGRAIEALSHASGNALYYTDGTIDGLIASMDMGGVDKSVVLNIATNPKQMQSVNNFAISMLDYNGRLVPFGSVHPEAENAVEELHRLHESGIKGVKFHPEYQDFFVDDDRLTPIYETLGKLGMISVFHAGMDNGFAEPVHGSPDRFAAVLDGFRAPVVLAHMGGYIMWVDVLNLLAGKNVYFDTSFCFSRIPRPLFRQIVEKHGADRILFASDSPWSAPAEELRLIESVELPEEWVAAIKGGNAAKLLGL